MKAAEWYLERPQALATYLPAILQNVVNMYRAQEQGWSDRYQSRCLLRR